MLDTIRDFLSFYRKITLAILLCGVAVSGIAFALAEEQFATNMESKRREVDAQNSHLALAIGQSLNRSIAQADTVLQLLKTEIETNGRLDDRQIELVKALLLQGIFNQIAVANSQGEVIFSAVPLRFPLNISDRRHFQVHIGRDSGNLYIAAPRINQVAGTASIFLSRRLNGPSGEFAGIVSAGVSVEFLANELAQLKLGQESVFMFLLLDGTLLVRVPKVETDQFIQEVQTNVALEKVRQGSAAGIYDSRGLADGVVRVGAFQKLNNYPAMVTVAISQEAAFRAVIARGEQYRRWAAMFSFVLWSLLLLLWRQLVRTYRAKDELSQAHAGLITQYRELRQAQESEHRAAAIQGVLKEIAEAAITASTLAELYVCVHRLVGKVLPAELLHINLIDEAAGALRPPLWSIRRKP